MKRSVLVRWAAALCLAAPGFSAHAVIIDLTKPVSDSVGTITGIYWTANTVTGTSSNRTPDSSGNNFEGTLEAGVTGGVPTLTTGVNLAGTSGYSNGIRLVSSSTVSTERNARIYTNPGSSTALDMAGTSFTGGAWLSFSSLQAGAQQVIVMDRGGKGAPVSNGGGWSFFLDKNAEGLWRLGFTARDNASSTTVYSGAFADLGITLDEWIHFGFSFQDVTGNPNIVSFWMDGTLVSSVNINRDITAGTTTSGQRFAVGEGAGNSSTQTSMFNGSVDDIFVTTGVNTFAFNPIPEPGVTALLVTTGVGLLAWRQRSRLRKIDSGRRERP